MGNVTSWYPLLYDTVRTIQLQVADKTQSIHTYYLCSLPLSYVWWRWSTVDTYSFLIPPAVLCPRRQTTDAPGTDQVASAEASKGSRPVGTCRLYLFCCGSRRLQALSDRERRPGEAEPLCGSGWKVKIPVGALMLQSSRQPGFANGIQNSTS